MPEIMINGPEGRLEGRYTHGGAPNAPIALFLHPHPQHGGTMNNRVVYTLYHTFAKRGFSCLRFNFRGVGRSQGVFAKGEGELSDAASALDWLQSVNENAQELSTAHGEFVEGMLDRRFFLRRLDRDAVADAAPGDHILYLHRPTGEFL